MTHNKLRKRIRRFVKKMRIMFIIEMKYNEHIMKIGDVYICTNCAITYNSEEEALVHIGAVHSFRWSPFGGE